MMSGLIFTIVVQIVGPLAIFIYAFYHLKWAGEQAFDYRQWRYEPLTVGDFGISNLMRRMLGTLFIFLFCLNGTYVMSSDRKALIKTQDMCAVFAQAARDSD